MGIQVKTLQLIIPHQIINDRLIDLGLEFVEKNSFNPMDFVFFFSFDYFFRTASFDLITDYARLDIIPPTTDPDEFRKSEFPNLDFKFIILTVFKINSGSKLVQKK